MEQICYMIEFLVECVTSKLCLANNVITFIVILFFLGMTIYEPTFLYQAGARQSGLAVVRIPLPTAGDLGHYTCLANNSVATTHSTILLSGKL